MGRRLVAGLVLACGVALLCVPEQLAGMLGRPYETSGQMINMRATWGGTVVGLGMFGLWLPLGAPRRRAALGLLMWLMIGIGLARGLGFVLVGSPDQLQWLWLLAEVVIALMCAATLWHTRTSSTSGQ